jgi:hypothetical protein
VGARACNAERRAVDQCVIAAPDSAFFCAPEYSVFDQSVCAQQQAALARCEQPAASAAALVCAAWTAACANPAACPRPNESLCVDDQVALLQCLLTQPARCDSAIPDPDPCADAQARVDACAPDFAQFCEAWGLECEFALHPTEPDLTASRQNAARCFALRPPVGRGPQCANRKRAYEDCIQTRLFGPPPECDLGAVGAACAAERAAVETCAAEPSDAGAAD